MQTGSQASTLHLEQIGQIAITVRDLARAKQFYRDVLGMRFLFDAGPMVFFQCGPVRLMLGLAENPVSPAGTIVYFKLDTLESAYAALVEQGVLFAQPPHLIARMPSHDLWMAFLEDGEGNTLGLMSELPRT